MFMVSHTLNHGNNLMEDFYTVTETLEEAQRDYAARIKSAGDSLHCAGISKIVKATEPHWVEGWDK